MVSLDNLDLIGFNMYSSKILCLLINGSVLTVKEMYNFTKIPKNKIYESLEKLKDDGIVGEEAGKPKKYFIINVNLIDEMILKKEKDLESLKERIEELKKPKEVLNPSVLSIIDGNDEIHKLLEYSNNSVKDEILSCSRLVRMHYGCYRSLKEAIDRGVRVKFIAIYNGKNFDVLKKYSDLGVEIRIFDLKKNKVFPKIGLFDKKFCRITIWNPDVENESDFKTIWANSSIMYNIVKNHFDKIWEESKVFNLKDYK